MGLKPSKASSSTPYSRQSFCSSQSVERGQDRHFLSWVERMSSSVVLRALRTFSELVWISMPSATGYTQAVTMPLVPVASTMQMRQAPISFFSFI